MQLDLPVLPSTNIPFIDPVVTDEFSSLELASTELCSEDLVQSPISDDFIADLNYTHERVVTTSKNHPTQNVQIPSDFKSSLDKRNGPVESDKLLAHAEQLLIKVNHDPGGNQTRLYY